MQINSSTLWLMMAKQDNDSIQRRETDARLKAYTSLHESVALQKEQIFTPIVENHISEWYSHTT